MNRQIIIGFVFYAFIFFGCSEDPKKNETVTKTPEEITKENLQEIQQNIQKEIRTTIATAKTRFIKELSRVSQTANMQTRKKMTKTIQREVERTLTHFGETLNQTVQNAIEDMKRITETNREKIQSDADMIKNRSIAEINEVSQTAGTETQGIVTESKKGKTHTTAITHFERDLQQTSQATLSETEKKLKGIAQEEIQSATTALKTRLREELNKAGKIITDSFVQHLETLENTDFERKDIYTITLQFDALKSIPFVKWGMQHEELKTKDSCLRLKESQFANLEVVIIRVIDKVIEFDQLCTYKEDEHLCLVRNYNIIKKTENGETDYDIDWTDKTNNDPDCINLF